MMVLVLILLAFKDFIINSFDLVGSIDCIFWIYIILEAGIEHFSLFLPVLTKRCSPFF